MEIIITYRKRSVTKQDIVDIRRIIKSHPDKSRRFISQEVCREWDWRQPNGVLKDMVCRSLLLLLESKSLIKLPARKLTPPNPLAKRKKPTKGRKINKMRFCFLIVPIISFAKLLKNHH